MQELTFHAAHTLPPQNVEVEEAILGGILLDPDAIDRVSDVLVAEAFYIPAHQIIYRAALTLHNQGKPKDLINVNAWLTDYDLLDRVGGLNKLTQLVERTVSAVNIDSLADLLIDKYLRRLAIGAGNKIVQLGYQVDLPLEEVLNTAEQEVFQLTQRQLGGSKTVDSATSAVSAWDLLNSSGQILRSGIHDLDKLIGGFGKKRLTVLAGRPSMGKSFVALNFALQMMVTHNLPVLYISMEMSKEQLQHRLWSIISAHPAYKSLGIAPLELGRLERHQNGSQPLQEIEIDELSKCLNVALDLPFYINDSSTQNLSLVASAIRETIKKAGQIGMVIVDYVQIGEEEGNNSDNRARELGKFVRGLFKLATTFDTHVVACSQLNRGVESRNNKRPMMSDLAQSGEIEAVADTIIGLYREEYYNPDTHDDKGMLDMLVLKNRHGSTGSCKTIFDSSYGMIRSLPSKY